MDENLTPALDAETLQSVLDAAGSPGYETWWARTRSAGYCAYPIRLTRTNATGVSTVFARCENRRAAVCPSCSDLYAADTWHLVAAGLDPEHLDGAAAVFATLTAPSFGPVHTILADENGTPRPCHRAGRSVCAHGTVSRCAVVHRAGDPLVGTPLCGDCYDYTAHVLTTWWFPQLWHRFTIQLRRQARAVWPGVRVSFVKVMEMQARLAPHYHAIIRTDPEGAAPLIESEQLAVLVRTATARAWLDVPGVGGAFVSVGFGVECDVQPITGSSTAARAAGYLAKYVTKNITDAPLPRRIPPSAIDALPISEHQKQIMRTLARLSETMPDEYGDMADRLPSLGWHGHTTTKSRAYSTTMREQKAIRTAWRALHSPDSGDDASGSDEWEYEGSGHRTAGQRFLAVSAALTHREQLWAARQLADKEGLR